MHHVEARSVACFIGTVSDTRTVDTDKSGLLIKEFLTEAGHVTIDHQIVRDDEQAISEMIDGALAKKDIDVILLTGGTGISMRDVTIEVVEAKLDKTIPGFGEIFRMLSYTEDIGSRAMMSRAVAGVVKEKIIVAMPGSSGAVKLAMNKLVIPEISHFIHELEKDK